MQILRSILAALIVSILLLPMSICGENIESIIIVGEEAPPSEFTGPHGEARGLAVDIWKLWGKRTGVKVDYRLMQWSEALRRVQAGEADVVSGMFRTPEREKVWDFSQPFYGWSTYIFFHKDISGIVDIHDLSGFRVGLLEGDAAVDVLKAEASDSPTVLFPTWEKLIQAVIDQHIKVFIADEPMARYYLAKMGAAENIKHTVKPLRTSRLHAGVRKGNESLLTLVNQGFAKISPQEIDAIEKKWAGIPVSPPWPWEQVIAVMLGMLGLLLLIHVTLLRIQVNKRTEELQNSQNDLENVVSEQTGELRQANEELLHKLGEIRDIQDQLIRSERLAAVGTLASGVAHEFNNLNTTILGFVDLARRDPALKGDTRDFVNRVYRAATNASEITRRLLAFSGQHDGKPQMCRLEDVAQETLSLVEGKFHKESILLDTDFGQTPPTAINPGKIGQVILNLLINAHHSLNEEAEQRITMRTGHNENSVWLEVEDTGCGIPEENLGRIFSPFFTTKGENAQDSETAAGVDGSGLGLSVSHTIVAQHNGHLKVKSTPGVGATFTLELPIRSLDEMPWLDTKKSGKLTEGEEKGTVLVVDDEEDIRHFIKRSLEMIGANVILAENGKRALEELDNNQIDLILLDLRMPIMTGYDLLERLTEKKLPRQPVVIVITGVADPARVDLESRYDIFSVLTKPFDVPTIQEKVEVALRLGRINNTSSEEEVR